MLRATRSAPGEKSASSSIHASTSARSRPSSISAGFRISSVTLARVERRHSSWFRLWVGGWVRGQGARPAHAAQGAREVDEEGGATR